MNTSLRIRPTVSDWINTWLEQNINEIGDDMKDISELDEIKEYLIEVVQDACSFVYSKQKEAFKQKQADGVRVALENGIHFGRTKMEIPSEFYQLYFRYKNGELSSRQCGEKLNVSHSTFLKWIKEVDSNA